MLQGKGRQTAQAVYVQEPFLLLLLKLFLLQTIAAVPVPVPFLGPASLAPDAEFQHIVLQFVHIITDAGEKARAQAAENRLIPPAQAYSLQRRAQQLCQGVMDTGALAIVEVGNAILLEHQLQKTVIGLPIPHQHANIPVAPALAGQPQDICSQHLHFQTAVSGLHQPQALTFLTNTFPCRKQIALEEGQGRTLPSLIATQQLNFITAAPQSLPDTLQGFQSLIGTMEKP